MARATFAPAGENSFQQELSRQVREYFRENDLSEGAGFWGAVSMGVKLLMLVVPYGLILTGSFSRGVMVLLAMMAGAATSGLGFSAHEGAHGSLFKSSFANNLIANGFSLLGVSLFNWKIAHNAVHHTYTNVYSLDEDLTTNAFLRFAPASPWRPHHRFQHIYVPLIYPFTIFYLVFVQDFRQLFMPKFGPYEKTLFTPMRLLTALLAKVFYVGWTLLVPLYMLELPMEQILAGFMIMHWAAGCVTAGIFMTAHAVQEVEFPMPDVNGRLADDFFVHQLRTTADYACSNKLLSWYIGGLNFQLEHHLFPLIASRHYPSIHQIVKKLATERGLPCVEFETFLSALKSHVLHLKNLSVAPSPNVQAPVWLAHPL